MMDALLVSEAVRAMAPVSDGVVRSLVNDMNRRGFGVIENAIEPEVLARMRRFVATAIDRAGGRYVGFNGSQAVAGSGLEELAESPEFHSIFTRLYEAAAGKAAPEVRFYQVLRCLTGEDALKHSYYFHYDSYLITALVPVEIPEAGQTGDFVMLPNTRTVRGTYGANLLDKLLLDNRLTQALLRTLLRRKPDRFARIQPKPGNIYFFWGYRSIHTNEPCDPDSVRATALFHYANPHENSSLNSMMRKRG